MFDDTAIRSMRQRSQHDYVRHVRAFAGFLRRSPDTATAEDVRRFQLYQRERRAGEAAVSGSISAPRFLFIETLERTIPRPCQTGSTRTRVRYSVRGGKRGRVGARCPARLGQIHGGQITNFVKVS
jgi:hypothetical protein